MPDDKEIFDRITRAYIEAKSSEAMESDLLGFHAVCWYYADWIMDKLAESCDPPKIEPLGTTTHAVPYPPGAVDITGWRITKTKREAK